jgi:hypothetical protein
MLGTEFEIGSLDMQKLENIRFEVIDGTGRQYVKYGVDLDFSVQDDERTLKIFVRKSKNEV